MIKKNYKDEIFVFGSIFIILSMVLVISYTIGNYDSVYAQENTNDFTATLSGKQVIPPVKTDGIGTANFEVGENSLSYQINVLNAGKIISVTINKGAIGTNGDAIVTLIESQDNDAKLIGNVPKVTGIASTTQSSSSFSASGNVNVSELTGPLKDKTIADLVTVMQSGQTYVNVQTQDHPEGELRGQISEANEE
jgi:hypothetical protein